MRGRRMDALSCRNGRVHAERYITLINDYKMADSDTDGGRTTLGKILVCSWASGKTSKQPDVVC